MVASVDLVCEMSKWSAFTDGEERLVDDVAKSKANDKELHMVIMTIVIDDRTLASHDTTV